jgi:hypothetical protein
MDVSGWVSLHAVIFQSYLEKISSGPFWVALATISAIVAKYAGIPEFISKLIKAYRSLSPDKLAAALESETGTPSFSASEIKNATKQYVWPNCTAIDPADQPDLRNVSVLAPALKTVSDMLSEKHARTHLILLADSGMGKTTFCLNFYAEEMRKRPKDRRRVAIVPLGRPDAMGQISAIADKRRTILLLDAFDEDPLALEGPYERLTTLMNAAANCPWVVVTCRSQFFPSDDRIPNSSGIMYAGPRSAGNGREYPLRKLFLAPFSNRQVDAYIKGHFPSWILPSYGRRKRAWETIHSIGELAVRPMLLELVPDLAREHLTLRELFGLYEYMVLKWFERESGWVEKDVLFNVSTLLAVDLYLQQRAGGDDRMLADELYERAMASGSAIDRWQLNSRSLLNRDVKGYFKFAHRSILEYLFVVSAIKGDARCFTVPWTELMKRLFVSWGHHRVDPDSDARACEILRSNLEVTGLLPFAHEIAGPSLIGESDIKRQLGGGGDRKGTSRAIPAGWRLGTISVKRTAGMVVVEDAGYGFTWELIDTLSNTDRVDAHIYRDATSKATREIYSALNLGPQAPETSNADGRRGRLPSLHEMWTLWECDQVLTSQNPFDKFLDSRELYWLGDALGIGRYLLCSVGTAPIQRLELLNESVGTRSSDSFYIYEFRTQTAKMYGDDFGAMTARIVT